MTHPDSRWAGAKIRHRLNPPRFECDRSNDAVLPGANDILAPAQATLASMEHLSGSLRGEQGDVIGC
jgi:hypothetical protein